MSLREGPSVSETKVKGEANGETMILTQQGKVPAVLREIGRKIHWLLIGPKTNRSEEFDDYMRIGFTMPGRV